MLLVLVLLNFFLYFTGFTSCRHLDLYAFEISFQCLNDMNPYWLFIDYLLERESTH